jgi:tRNA-dihydrouridine synthase A
MRTGPSWIAIMVVSRLPVSFGISKGFSRLRSRFVSTHLYSDTKHNAGVSSRQSKYDELMAASRLSLAPMMEYTDKHFRHLVRLISNRTLLYTEMVAVNAISHERRAQIQSYQLTYPEATKDEIQKGYDDFYLRRSLSQCQMPPLEGPSVLQVGGSDPRHMYDAAQTVLEMRDRGVCDYTAINLNCGCPSPKVAGKGCFGAALMTNGKLVAELCQVLHEGSQGTLPITVKCRIGTDLDSPFTVAGYKALDEESEYSKLCRFIEAVASSGIVTDFVIHARIAVLTKNFSPADNRKVPPLKYNLIRRLVQDYPEFTFTLNGGIETIAQAQDEFQACPGLTGVMIGRSWAADPWSFAMADQLLYKEPMNPAKNRLHVLQEYCRYADAEESEGDPQKIRRFLIKAITPLFAGETNGKRYRIALDEIASLPKKLHLQGKTMDKYPPLSELIMNAAMENLSEETLHRTPEECYAMASLRQSGQIGRSQSVVEWQELRAKQGTSRYDEMLSGGIGN